MSYRIVKITYEDGIKYFYIQKRFLIFFWRYITKMVGFETFDYVKYGCLDDAKRYIEFKETYKTSNTIIKKEIVEN